MGPLSCLSVCNVAVLWPNDWMDQDKTWYGGRHRPRRHCDIVLDGDPAPPPKRHSSPPIFDPCLYDQTTGWVKMPLVMEVSLGPCNIDLDGDPVPQSGTAPNLRPNVCCSQTSEWIKMSHYVRWGPSSTQKGHNSPPSFLPMSVVAKRSPISAMLRKFVF